MVYLVVLLALALIYLTNPGLLHLTRPFVLGSMPIGVPWFGALGAVIISLSGAFDHRTDWDPSWNLWHFTRPLIGITLAIISWLIFQTGILAVGSKPDAVNGVTPDLLYYVIAFIVGYREDVFRDLIKTADVILAPGGSASRPAVNAVNPLNGSAAGGDKVAITGSSLTGTTSVKFGTSLAPTFHVDSDTQISATTPPGVVGPVNVTVTTKGGSITGGEFTYQ